jgi:uncharacterized membrane protein YccC
MAGLTALLILLADFRGDDQFLGYVGTCLGALVMAGLGTLPLPVWAAVLMVALCSAVLGGMRGFSGYFATASVTLTAVLLIAQGLRSAAAPPMQVLTGALAGVAASLIVARFTPGPQQPLQVKAQTLDGLYEDILAGRRPPSDAQGTSHELVTAYVEATDRPAAPTRSSADDLMRLDALARTGDLLAEGLLERAEPRLPTHSEWREQLRYRMRPDSILFVQALVAAVLYGGLTWLVFSLRPPHPQWILLGAVTAAYPYARRSAVILRNLLIGTFLAFAVLLVVIPLANVHPAAWWLVMIIAAAVSSGAPSGQGGWILGQLAFTTLSLSLLALSMGSLDPHVIETRLENVLIGGLSAVIAAALLAPHHMRRRYQRALADLYEAVGDSQTRALFLRCTDLIEAMRGSTYVLVSDLADWLDAARRAREAADPSLRAAELRANRAVPDEPLLVRLSPLLPRGALRKPAASRP